MAFFYEELVHLPPFQLLTFFCAHLLPGLACKCQEPALPVLTYVQYAPRRFSSPAIFDSTQLKLIAERVRWYSLMLQISFENGAFGVGRSESRDFKVGDFLNTRRAVRMRKIDFMSCRCAKVRDLFPDTHAPARVLNLQR